MAKKGPKIQLFRGPEKSYYMQDTEESVVKAEYLNAVYFATDSQKILMNGTLYGQGKLGKVVGAVKVEKEPETGDYILNISYTDGDTYKFNLGTLLRYNSKLPDDEVVPVKIGNIQAGTKVKDLKTKTISEILDDIIFPEVQPDVLEPKAIIGFANPETYQSGMLMEVGAEAPKDFITNFFKGHIKVIGHKPQFRSGELINDPITCVICNGENKLPDKVVLGEMDYQYRVHYDQGPVALTSKNIPSTVITPNPLPEGVLSSGPIKIYGTYPYFSNGLAASTEFQEMRLPIAIGSMTPLPLQKWDERMVGVMFSSEASTENRACFWFHENKEILKVEFFNTVGGTWCILNEDCWEVKSDPQQKIIQGEKVDYKYFTTKGNLLGAIQLRFTLEDVIK